MIQRMLSQAFSIAGSVSGPARALAERAFVNAVSDPRSSRVMADLVDIKLPPAALVPIIRAYCRAFEIDLSDVELPLNAFPTFNAFFTRALKEGARPVLGGPLDLASPADARLSVWGPIDGSGAIESVKGRAFSAAALLGYEGDLVPFEGGSYTTLYLSPRDYHRVHCPVDGKITRWRHIPGRLYPVNDLSLRTVEGVFAKNERIVVHIETEAHGEVAVVFVGAANVGRISLAFSEMTSNHGGPGRSERPAAPIPVSRGDELGQFNLGSTVVLLTERPMAAPPIQVPGEMVQVGQTLWRSVGPA